MFGTRFRCHASSCKKLISSNFQSNEMIKFLNSTIKNWVSLFSFCHFTSTWHGVCVCVWHTIELIEANSSEHTHTHTPEKVVPIRYNDPCIGRSLTLICRIVFFGINELFGANFRFENRNRGEKWKSHTVHQNEYSACRRSRTVIRASKRLRAFAHE